MFAGCRCPRCPETVLAATQREGCKMLACRRCGGALVSADVGLRLLAVLAPDVPPADLDQPRAPCPVCRKPMRLVLATTAKVNVDVCSMHGVWFDGDDLAAVLRAVAHSMGKPVPDALGRLEEHARGRPASPTTPTTSSPPSPPPPSGPPSPAGSSPTTPRWQPSPTQSSRSTFVPTASPRIGVFGNAMEDATDIVVGVALIPVELTVGVIGGLIDLLD
ncbi:MAG: zf-TFIIB domain-containing protein [Myxococcota bacterium]